MNPALVFYVVPAVTAPPSSPVTHPDFYHQLEVSPCLLIYRMGDTGWSLGFCYVQKLFIMVRTPEWTWKALYLQTWGSLNKQGFWVSLWVIAELFSFVLQGPTGVHILKDEYMDGTAGAGGQGTCRVTSDIWEHLQLMPGWWLNEEAHFHAAYTLKLCSLRQTTESLWALASSSVACR